MQNSKRINKKYAIEKKERIEQEKNVIELLLMKTAEWEETGWLGADQGLYQRSEHICRYAQIFSPLSMPVWSRS